MKNCPHCAEEIQDNAVVCKHCNRSVAGSNGRKWFIAAVVLVAVYFVATFLLKVGAASQEATLQAEAAARPTIVQVGDGEPIEIKPGGYHHWSFELPSRQCAFTAHVEGVTGGNKDFEGLILGDDDFKNWVTNHAAQAVQSGRVAAWSPKTTLTGPGTFHLVVSNAFSTVSTKVVVAQGSITCPA